MGSDRPGAHRHRTARRRPRFQVERLEDRALLTTLVALTEAGNQLLRFDSAAPSAILGTATITGLQANESIIGIDVRPATGELYGVGSTSRLYTINPLTGAATQVRSLTVPLVGTNFGVDFNPVPDRLRVVSDADQNLRINPNNGAVADGDANTAGIQPDTPLAFDAGDRLAGQNPSVVDVAYTNNVNGATTTTLYGLDSNFLSQKTLGDGSVVQSQTLVRQGGLNVPPGTPSPNGGLLFSIGAFGRTGVTPTGFDIAPSGTAFVAINALAEGSNTPRSLLLTLDVTTGGDASQGNIGDGGTALRDIAVLPSVQFSAPLFAIAEDGGSATITVTRTEGNIGPATVAFAVSGSATAGSDFNLAAGTLTFGPGVTSQTITVPVLNDAEPEGDESVVLTLSNPTGGVVLGGNSTATLRINASDQVDRTGPVITRILETGPSRGITGAVLQFNEDLNPARAVNLANYSLFGIGPGARRTRIALSSAVYDPVARTVTLGAAPFMQTNFRQLQFRVSGRRNGVTDLAGNRLNSRNGSGGADSMFRFAVFSGTSVSFTDRDGDVATLTIANGGRLDGIRPMQGPRSQTTQFWILDPIALRSTLSGTVTRSATGDGLVVIAEIIGLDKKEITPLLTNTSFRVNTLTFSSNATGIG